MRRARWILARCLYYPTLGWNLVRCRFDPARHWWDRIDAHIIVGAVPFAAHLPSLHAIGVRAIVNSCEEFAGHCAAYRSIGIEQLHIPTIDFTPPSLEDIERAVVFISSHVDQQHTVYIHCKAGRGRSASVALCWLIASHNVSPEEAQAILQKHRPHVSRSLHLRSVVRQFADKHNASRTSE